MKKILALLLLVGSSAMAASMDFNFPTIWNWNGGNTYFMGNVGIGTTSSLNTLDVKGNAAFGTYGGVSAAPSNGMIISGNVGIGTSGPSTALQVNGRITTNQRIDNTTTDTESYRAVSATTGASSLRIGNTVNSVYWGIDAHDSSFFGAGPDNTVIYSDSDIEFMPSHNRRMIVRGASGNVGIGTTVPANTLDIQAATSVERIKSTTGTNSASMVFANTGGNVLLGIEKSTGQDLAVGSLAYSTVLSNDSTRALHLGTNNNVRLTVDSGGNVGVGTTAPTYLFQLKSSGTTNQSHFKIQTSASVNQFILESDASGNAYNGIYDGSGNRNILFNSGGDSYFNGGNVGIGTTTISARLVVSGHQHFTGTAPSVGTGAGDCGTSPAIVGNDNVGRVTVGSSTNGGFCTITFAAAWTNAPICMTDDETTGVIVRATNTATGSFRITGVIVAGDALTYRCVGYQ
jgi:hypothetical protein